MVHLKTRRMKRFPIEKLPYHLKLELLENMGPGDVIELVNVNRGFRSIVVGEPWQIFGKHVDWIWIEAGSRLDAKSIGFVLLRKLEFRKDHWDEDQESFRRCMTLK